MQQHPTDPRHSVYRLERYLSTRAAQRSDEPYVRRLAFEFERIVACWASVYGADRFRWTHVERLLDVVWIAHQERSPRLKRLDAQRVNAGAWYADGTRVGYQLYLDRFAGNLRGMIPELDYLQALGVNVVHIMPFFSVAEGANDGGYAVSDHGSVNPAFGTVADLVELTQEMHDRGMALVTDFVVNHTSDQHAWAIGAKRGDPECQARYYCYPDRTVPDQFDATMPEVFPATAPGNFTFNAQMQRWVMTVFHPYQWDLNYHNPRVAIDMIATMLRLVNWGIDLLRLDAVPYLWKAIGSTSRNLAQAHLLARLFHAAARIAAPGTALIAEAIVQPREIARYFGEGSWSGRECELAYNASTMVLLWDAVATTRSVLIERALEELPSPPAESAWVNYVRCHDDIGLGYEEPHLHAQGWNPAAHRAFIVAYYCGEYPGSQAGGVRFMDNPATGDARISGTAASLAGLEAALANNDYGRIERAIRILCQLHALVYALPGVPVLYAGDEVACLNDYRYIDDADLAADNRWVHRPRIGPAKRRALNAPGTVGERITAFLARLARVRTQHAAIRSGGGPQVVRQPNPHVLAFERRSADGTRVVVISNFSPQPQLLSPRAVGVADQTMLSDLLCDPAPSDARFDGTVPAHTTLWLASGAQLQRQRAK